jgi:cytochrome b subunit of formate dehydrogenase
MFGPENIWLIAGGGLAALICNICYMIGGTEMSFGGQKWIRRYLGAGILAIASNVIAFLMQAWLGNIF